MTELRFVDPNLRQLDLARADVIACGVYEDQRPMGGLAGLIDWRLAGLLSALARRRFIVGAVGELVLVPARPKLPFDKLLVVGLGPRAAFAEETFTAAFDRVARSLDGLAAKRAIVELPGRGDEAITPERALALTLAGSREVQREKMVLVEEDEARRRMAAFAEEEALRVRRG
jgi:leucyl aminopeptidase